jgi:EpsI family protein
MMPARTRAVVVVILMAASFGAAFVWTPRSYLADSQPKLDLEAAFPRSFAGWRVDDRMPAQLVSPDQAQVLSKIYSQTLSRTYVNSAGERVMLSVAYGGDQSDGTRAHRPEVCYPAQGFQIMEQSVGSIVLLSRQSSVKRLVARQGGRNEPITYWMTVGERTALSGPEQKLVQLRYTMRGVIPDGMLVRVSSIDADSKRAYRTQDAFLTSLSEATPAVVRGRVFGTS